MNSNKRKIIKLGLCLVGGAPLITACGGGNEAETGAGEDDQGITQMRDTEVCGNISKVSASNDNDVSNILVSIRDRATATDGSGRWCISGVAPGDASISFEIGRNNGLAKQGSVTFESTTPLLYETTTPIAVPELGEVRLNNIELLGNTVFIQEIVITNADGSTSVVRDVFLDTNVTQL